MGSLKVKEDGGGGLGNQALLDKIDKLHALNIGADIPLPQLVVVGDQSSGKSSVLESLTGFAFPRAAGLCTRYATLITCLRSESKEYTNITIIPRPSANEEEQKRLRAFSRRVEAGEELAFTNIFEDANREMGIRPLDDKSTNTSLSTFSENVLKLEICGPEQVHLTVIDVPGIFRNATPGLTTESDIELVRTMVKGYMKDSRTIILAVIPCNADIATQEILKLAKEADPSGLRTMGVLTKPDLAIEQATQQPIIDLVLGKRNDLKLGYCIVKNRNADDQDSSIQERHDKERAFFLQDPWSKIANSGRTGVDALKKRLRALLLGITKEEFPNVRNEVNNRLKHCREKLQGYGLPRSDSQAQRLYLVRLANDFQKVVHYALEANYVHASIFDENEKMRLITRIVGLNEAFSRMFERCGHSWKWKSLQRSEDNLKSGDKNQDYEQYKLLLFMIGTGEYPELEDIIPELEDCGQPSDDSLMDHIMSVHKRCRGPELGTFGNSILGTVFKEQSKKWRDLVMAHIAGAILMVHDFIVELLHHVVTDQNVRTALWEHCLLDKLCEAYKRAVAHANFLLDIEVSTRPSTYNHYFSSNLNKFKLDRIEKYFEEKARNLWDNNTGYASQVKALTLADLRSMTVEKDNAIKVQEDIHDILRSYYKVARKRIVDTVCQQAVEFFLLYGKQGGEGAHKSPVAIFDSELILGLTDIELESIAGEDPWTKQQREALGAEIKNLVEATKILRG